MVPGQRSRCGPARGGRGAHRDAARRHRRRWAARRGLHEASRGRIRARDSQSPGGEVMPKIFFATDLHGSEMCWRKFLNAAKFYDADVLICGGDMTGKAMIPIVEGNGHYTVTIAADRRVVRAEQVRGIEKQIRRRCYLPPHVTAELLH